MELFATATCLTSVLVQFEIAGLRGLGFPTNSDGCSTRATRVVSEFHGVFPNGEVVETNFHGAVEKDYQVCVCCDEEERSLCLLLWERLLLLEVS